MYKIQLCSLFKSQEFSFNTARGELKLNFRVIGIFTSDNHVENFINYEYIPKKVQFQLINMTVYDINSFITDKAVPYTILISKLSKLSGKNNRDITENEYQKCSSDCIVSKGINCFDEILDHNLHFQGEPKRVNKKLVKWNLYLLAHKGSGFESYVVINNLPQWQTVVILIKNGSGIVSFKIFNGFVDKSKKVPQYVFFQM